jgi:hypothetical protein
MKQGGALWPLPFSFVLEYAIKRYKKIRKHWNGMEHIRYWSILIIFGGNQYHKEKQTSFVRG